jgi:hypothetical protein
MYKQIPEHCSVMGGVSGQENREGQHDDAQFLGQAYAPLLTCSRKSQSGEETGKKHRNVTFPRGIPEKAK